MACMVSKLPLSGCFLCAMLLLAPSPGAASESSPPFETRCGWFSNPTPANIWLYDRDGDWTIGVQGGHQVEGDWDWPAFKPGQWVARNGSHGYGCACLEMQADHATRKVLAIKSVRARTLAACRRDPTLKRWKSLFR